MRLNFKKISAIATSALMVGMTMGLAAAANYPAPFVQNSAADVAIVVGTGAGVSPLDGIQASNIQKDLQGRVSGTGSIPGSVTGEAYALFTSSSKVYMNDSINAVKSILTKTELPTVLADGSFEGDVSADVTQTITLGPYSRVLYAKQPTSDTDPVIGIQLGTTAGNYLYNASVNFNKAVNLSDSDSIGSEITLFGQKFTVGSGTTSTNLYLFKSSQKVDLSIGGTDPSSTSVTVDSKTYTVELITATSTDATIKVTDSTGASDTKKITDDTSRKVQGLDVAVTLSSSSSATNKETAEITLGSNKLKLTNGDTVKQGSDETSIDGTNVALHGGDTWNNVTSFTVQAYAQDSDTDAILAGNSFKDPVFGTFKVDFPGVNIPETSTDRETISVKASGADKATVNFINHDGNGDGKNLYWYNNASQVAKLQDSSGYAYNVIEMNQINKSEYVIVGNQNEGELLQLVTITNGTTGYSDDAVKFKDAMSPADNPTYYDATITSEGVGTLTVGGKSYALTYAKSSTTDPDGYVRLNYPDSTTATTQAVIFPTIETSKGAKLFFYEPQTIALANWDGSSHSLGTLKFPDGDGYTDVSVAFTGNGSSNVGMWQIGGTNVSTNLSSSWVSATIGQLTYNITGSGTDNSTIVYLQTSDGLDNILNPAIVFFEEQDASTSRLYNAEIVRMEGSGTSSAKVGVSDVEATWGTDSYWDNLQLNSDNDLYKDMDYYGTVVTTDKSDSDSYSATISYPDNQVYPQLYVGEVSSSITAGTSGSSGGTFNGVVVLDSEVGTQSGKNIIVVGGSCINSAAATLVGGAYCGDAWTTATGVGSGQFLIQGYATNTLTSKLALLVAGYNAADTVNAATYLTKQVVDTAKKYKGTSSTTAELVTTTA
jgi:hypothetical protein